MFGHRFYMNVSCFYKFFFARSFFLNELLWRLWSLFRKNVLLKQGKSVQYILWRRTREDAPGNCLNLACPDLRILLNFDLIPLLKLIMLFQRTPILLLSLLIYPVNNASLCVLSPGTAQCWFNENLFTSSGIFLSKCLEYGFMVPLQNTEISLSKLWSF